MVAPLAAILALLALAPAAAAQGEPLPEDNSGTGQYVEPVPDAEGDRPATPGSDRDRPRSQLPPETRADLPGGEEGRILERIATDPGAGAPAGGGGEADGRGGSGERGGEDETTPARVGAGEESALGTLVGAVVDPDRPALGIVLLAGIGLTLAAGFAGLRRRRA